MSQTFLSKFERNRIGLGNWNIYDGKNNIGNYKAVIRNNN